MLDKFRETAITWDKANRKVYEPLRASAGDNKGRKLSVQVVNNGVVENLSGASLSLYWETKDKAHKGLDAFAAVDSSKGEFEIYYTTGMLSNEGTLNANLVLVDANGRIVSEPFTITVFKGIDDDAIQSSDSFTALTEALAQVGTINNKADRAELLALESTFEQNKVSVDQQLADKADKSQIGAPTQEQVDAWLNQNPQATTTVQDKAVTWAKRTETGSFAKVLTMGGVPNFDLNGGVLTFPTAIRILVGTDYHSVPATSVSFSSLLSVTTQILILFNTVTKSFEVLSPTSLNATHDRSVLIATITNVSGYRREAYINCPFSVNNIPYLPDIERMLLSVAIPNTMQETFFHKSGVIHMIQHKDAQGNTIRTDTFTFSTGQIIEERRHNLSNTKITFTTNLTTLKTEVK